MPHECVPLYLKWKVNICPRFDKRSFRRALALTAVTVLMSRIMLIKMKFTFVYGAKFVCVADEGERASANLSPLFCFLHGNCLWNKWVEIEISFTFLCVASEFSDFNKLPASHEVSAKICTPMSRFSSPFRVEENNFLIAARTKEKHLNQKQIN